MKDFFLADDLSGALDAAAAFHACARRVRIVFASDTWAPASDDDVIGVTTETRNAAPAVAAQAVARAIAHGQAQGARLVYKKIDSTLRGPVAAELRALSSALPDAKILFTPANPRVGRTVCGGMLCVHGVPVAETEFARDPVSPVRQSDIRTLLGDAATPGVTIADAETEADLKRAVEQIAERTERWIAVGSGALAVPVAAQVSPPAALRRLPSLRPGAAADGTRVLMVCGSLHPANHAQAELLAGSHDIARHEIDLRDPLGAARAALASAREWGGATLLLPRKRHDSATALRAIAAAAQHVIENGGIKRIFVTGGETAFALCRALGVSSLQFLVEVEPGLSVSREAGEARDLIFAIKPGGFGDARTWLRALEALQAAA